jgi:hypothetical protein
MVIISPSGAVLPFLRCTGGGKETGRGWWSSVPCIKQGPAWEYCTRGAGLFLKRVAGFMLTETCLRARSGNQEKFLGMAHVLAVPGKKLKDAV